jgi:uroporphyrinogen-III synthase
MSQLGRVTLTMLPAGDPGWLTARALRALEQADVLVVDQELPGALLMDTGALRIPVNDALDAIRAVQEEASRGQAVCRISAPSRWEEVLELELPELRTAGMRVTVLPAVAEAEIARAGAVSHAPSGSLAGRRVLVLRSGEQQGPLAELLEAAGAQALQAPVLAIEAPDWSQADPFLTRMDRYRWLVLTSANGVESLLGRLRYLGLDVRRLPPRLAAVGPETTRRLEDVCLRPDLVPDGEASQDGLLDAFRQRGVRGQSILIATGDRRRADLARGLQALGAVVDEAIVYRTVARTPPAWVSEELEAGRVDAVLFSSGSMADFLWQRLSPGARRGLRACVKVSIGPVTSRRLRDLGLEPEVEAASPSMAMMVAGLAAWWDQANR